MLFRSIAKDVVEWLKDKPNGVRVGSIMEKEVEDKSSLESFLREGGYSNVGKLGSFFAPLLGSAGLNVAIIDSTRPNKIKLK